MPQAHDAPELLVVSVSSEADAAVVALRGELDMSTADRLRGALDRAAATGGPVVLDLGELTFMDASGLRQVLEAYQRLGHRLTLRPGPPQVQRLFTLTGLEDRLPFTGSVGDTSTEQDAANVRYVRELWRAFRAGGVPALLALVPQQAKWHAAQPSGDDTPEAMSRFWQATAGTLRTGESAVLTRVEAIHGDVIVRSELSVSPALTNVVWSLYVFEGRTLIRAVSFGSETAARRHAAELHDEP